MIGDLKTMIKPKPKDKPKAYRGVQSYLTEDQIANPGGSKGSLARTLPFLRHSVLEWYIILTLSFPWKGEPFGFASHSKTVRN